MIPVTPTSNTFSVETVADSQGTPLGLGYDGEKDNQNEIRYLIAQSMNSEMLLCKIKAFLNDYGPPLPLDTDVDKCASVLEHAQLLTQTNDGLKWTAFQTNPSKMPANENTAFEPLDKIIKAIFEYAGSRRQNQYEYVRLPYAWIGSDIAGANHKMDGCIVEKYSQKALPSDNAMVPHEFKKHRNLANQIEVREQIVGDCQHIMNNDPTRMFIYGITIEDDRFSVWYFSRSHSVKAVSFNWLSNENEERGIECFIRLFLALALATPEQLGIDPLVVKAHRPSMKDPQQYIYMYPQSDEEYAAALSDLEDQWDEKSVAASLTAYEDENSARQSSRLANKAAATKAERDKISQLKKARLSASARETMKYRYFKTINHIGPLRPYCISGRVTRVWRVHEVKSISDETPVTNKVLILKDVWLDTTRMTEAENMEAICSDIEELLALARKKYPGDDWLDQLLDKNWRFSQFDGPAKDRLKVLLTDENYKSLFLTKVVAWPGRICKAVSQRAREVPEGVKLFAELDITTKRRLILRESTQFGSDSKTKTGEKHAPRLIDAMELNPKFGRKYAQKQQSRFVYEEVCSELHDLETLGNFINIIDQALTACQILFCAGWVHRDISKGNVLALKTGDGSWKVKLCDLEFAQRVGQGTPHSDPRTGTPYFMPYEIMTRKHLLNTYRNAVDPEDCFAKQITTLKKGTPEYNHCKQFWTFPGGNLQSVPRNARIDEAPEREAIPRYNYQHDLESMWWLVMYFILRAVPHPPSQIYGKRIFMRSLIASNERTETFCLHINGVLDPRVHPKLAPGFIAAMELMRKELYRGYLDLEVFGLLTQDKAYSGIHAKMARMFRELLEKNEGGWKDIHLVDPNSEIKTMPVKRPIVEADSDNEQEVEQQVVQQPQVRRLPPAKKMKLDSDDEV